MTRKRYAWVSGAPIRFSVKITTTDKPTALDPPQSVYFHLGPSRRCFLRNHSSTKGSQYPHDAFPTILTRTSRRWPCIRRPAWPHSPCLAIGTDITYAVTASRKSAGQLSPFHEGRYRFATTARVKRFLKRLASTGACPTLLAECCTSSRVWNVAHALSLKCHATVFARRVGVN